MRSVNQIFVSMVCLMMATTVQAKTLPAGDLSSGIALGSMLLPITAQPLAVLQLDSAYQINHLVGVQTSLQTGWGHRPLLACFAGSTLRPYAWGNALLPYLQLMLGGGVQAAHSDFWAFLPGLGFDYFRNSRERLRLTCFAGLGTDSHRQFWAQLGVVVGYHYTWW